MPGAADVNLLKNALKLETAARLEAGAVILEVTVSNQETGHHVPTGSPLRQVILVIEARDENGHSLEQIAGPKIPAWGGVGSPEKGFYGSLPGEIYAKLLMEEWTEITPAASYWNLTRLISDNRIAAKEQRATRYVFSSNSSRRVQVEVKLLFRRAFIELMQQKGWSVPDVVMAKQQLLLETWQRKGDGTDGEVNRGPFAPVTRPSWDR